MVTAAKAAPSFHTPNCFLLVCSYWVQKSISPCWLLDHLCQYVVMKKRKPKLLDCLCPTALLIQKISGWFDFPTRTRDHESQSSSSWWKPIFIYCFLAKKSDSWHPQHYHFGYPSNLKSYDFSWHSIHLMGEFPAPSLLSHINSNSPSLPLWLVPVTRNVWVCFINQWVAWHKVWNQDWFKSTVPDNYI